MCSMLGMKCSNPFVTGAGRRVSALLLLENSAGSTVLERIEHIGTVRAHPFVPAIRSG
jgi:hypothetical protein